MKYMLLIYDNDSIREQFRNDPSLMEDMQALLEEITQSGELVATDPLADPSQTVTVRPRDGVPTPTDGPFAEAKEHLGGYLIVDVESRDRAVEIATRWTSTRFLPMEVRPIMDVSGEEM